MPAEQNNTADASKNPAKDNNTLMGVLAYLGPLVFVPYFAEKEDPFVKFHTKQGFVLFGIEVVIWFLSATLWTFWVIWQFVNLAVAVLAILGIVHVLQGKQEELPLVGQFADNIPV